MHSVLYISLFREEDEDGYFHAILRVVLYLYFDCESDVIHYFSTFPVNINVICSFFISFHPFPHTDICCNDLKSTTFGSPDPFLKLCLTCGRGGVKLPHHGQKADTKVIYNTVCPRWSKVIMMYHYCMIISNLRKLLFLLTN